MTMSSRLVVVHPDAQVLAAATAARLLTRILDAQSLHRPVHAVLTGGTVGIATLTEAANSPLVAAVDWSGVHLWWGDERFLATGDPERNETQARAALIDALVTTWGLPEHNVHPIAGPDRCASPEESAAGYAAELATLAAPGAVPAFDVLLLGMGPDGHVASLFPGLAGLDASGITIGVHDSPKPPTQRISLTFEAINAAQEVWVVIAGAEKAEQAAAALAGQHDVPAARVHGTERTLWLLDTASADAP
jgi:6-phosphogluconolactonase